jgi:inosine-uridine nucleoside N-ribohydrolase
MNKWIIDTDAGIDDAGAIMLALASKLDVVAITTVSGNTCEDNVFRNVKEILRVCGKDIPIYRGAKRPILNQNCYCPEYHGEDGLNGYWSTHLEIEDFGRSTSNETAANAIVRLALETPGINIMCLGPLTNLALAFCIDQSLSFSRVEIMGGTLEAIGNITTLAEFNIFTDPEAAAIVFERCPHLIMTPWESTNRQEISLSKEFFEIFKEGGPRSKFFWEIGNNMTAFCDGVAAAVAIDPSIALEVDEYPVVVELYGKYSRGHTVIMRDEISLRDSSLKRMKIIRRVDAERFKQMIIELIKD